MAEGGVDGEDLGVAHVADRPGLADGGALHRDGDVDVHDRRGPGVGEVLGGGPHQRPAGGALEGLDGGTQSAAAEQEAVAGAEVGRDREVPAVGVVGRLQAEEREGIHGGRPYARGGRGTVGPWTWASTDARRRWRPRPPGWGWARPGPWSPPASASPCAGGTGPGSRGPPRRWGTSRPAGGRRVDARGSHRVRRGGRRGPRPDRHPGAQRRWAPGRVGHRHPAGRLRPGPGPEPALDGRHVPGRGAGHGRAGLGAGRGHHLGLGAPAPARPGAVQHRPGRGHRLPQDPRPRGRRPGRHRQLGPARHPRHRAPPSPARRGRRRPRRPGRAHPGGGGGPGRGLRAGRRLPVLGAGPLRHRVRRCPSTVGPTGACSRPRPAAGRGLPSRSC